MAAESERCPHFNSGYCKFTSKCKFLHPIEICEKNCKEKTCLKRHPKHCKQGKRCTFLMKQMCAYKHVGVNSEDHTVKELKEMIESLSMKVKPLVNNISIKYQEISDLKDKVEKLETKPIGHEKTSLNVTIDENDLEENLKGIHDKVQVLEESVVEIQVKTDNNEQKLKYNTVAESDTDESIQTLIEIVREQDTVILKLEDKVEKLEKELKETSTNVNTNVGLLEEAFKQILNDRKILQEHHDLLKEMLKGEGP